MLVINNENTVFIDIDETLVMHNESNKDLYVTCPYSFIVEELTVHSDHVKQLIKNKARGYYIVVWSHAGHKWAEAVIKAMGLSDCVDLIITKPSKIIDDNEPNQFLANRVYLPYRG